LEAEGVLRDAQKPKKREKYQADLNSPAALEKQKARVAPIAEECTQASTTTCAASCS
jgi:hypothetical protein